MKSLLLVAAFLIGTTQAFASAIVICGNNLQDYEFVEFYSAQYNQAYALRMTFDAPPTYREFDSHGMIDKDTFMSNVAEKVTTGSTAQEIQMIKDALRNQFKKAVCIVSAKDQNIILQVSVSGTIEKAFANLKAKIDEINKP